MKNIKAYKIFEASGDDVSPDNADLLFITEIFECLKDEGFVINIQGYEEYGPGKNLQFRCILKNKHIFNIMDLRGVSENTFRTLDSSVKAFSEYYEMMKDCVIKIESTGLKLLSFEIQAQTTPKNQIYGLIDFIRTSN